MLQRRAAPTRLAEELLPAQVRLQLRLEQAGQLVAHVVGVDHVGMRLTQQLDPLGQVAAVIADDLGRHADPRDQAPQLLVHHRAGGVFHHLHHQHLHVGVGQRPAALLPLAQRHAQHQQAACRAQLHGVVDEHDPVVAALHRPLQQVAAQAMEPVADRLRAERDVCRHGEPTADAPQAGRNTR